MILYMQQMSKEHDVENINTRGRGRDRSQNNSKGSKQERNGGRQDRWNGQRGASSLAVIVISGSAIVVVVVAPCRVVGGIVRVRDAVSEVADDLRTVLGQGVYGPLHLYKKGCTRSALTPTSRTGGGTYVSRELNRENRGVNNPNTLQAVHPQLGIDDTTLVTRQHSEGVRRMELGRDTVGNKLIDRIVSGDSRTRTDFSAEDTAQWGGSCNLPSELDGLPHQLNISPMGKVLRVDDGRVEGIVGGDVQPSMAEWVLKGELDGDRLVATRKVSGSIQQDLDLTDTGREELLGVSEVESFVTRDDTRVSARYEASGVTEAIENLLLESDGIIGGTDDIRNVGVASC